MASYLETLMADQARLRQSLMAEIETEAAAVRELQERLEASSRTMDQMIVRLQIYRRVYGNSATQTLDLQTAIEDHGKPHSEVGAELADHQRVLQAMQEALLQIDQGGRIDGAEAAKSVSIADILNG